ncbi:MAG: acyltransferase [Chthoniobacterales bacterium]|nr:acyltransferase [Chthoniobacterales bacterium]
MNSSSLDPRFPVGKREPGLDLLRTLAIVLVVVYHIGIFGFAVPNDWHRFGWVGVDLFFVLSGYLIGGQLLAMLARGQPIEFRRFYVRRALRILPPYFAVLAIYFLWPSAREFPTISPLWNFCSLFRISTCMEEQLFLMPGRSRWKINSICSYQSFSR